MNAEKLGKHVMLNFAIIGCGQIAKRHVNLLTSGQISSARLVAVCDYDYNRAKVVSSQYNVPAYSNMDKMLQKEKIDVVVVLTPSGLHAEHVINLSYYQKDIMVEKPMALTVDDADAMNDACDRNNCRLFVVKQNRFNLPVTKLNEARLANRFGKMVLGTVRVRWARHQTYYDKDAWRGTWAMDGGVLANQASHHIDMLQWIMGSVKSVFARSVTALSNIEAEDTAVVILNFSCGALGIIEATTATRPRDLEGSISILGEKGNVVIGGFAANEIVSWAFEDHKDEDDDVLENYSANPTDTHGFGHRSYYRHVVECILHEGPNLVDGLEGRKSVQLINAIYESIETGKEVFLRFKPKTHKLGQM